MLADIYSHTGSVFVSGDFFCGFYQGIHHHVEPLGGGFKYFFPNAFREGFPFIVGGLRVGHGRVASCLSWMRKNYRVYLEDHLRTCKWLVAPICMPFRPYLGHNLGHVPGDISLSSGDLLSRWLLITYFILGGGEVLGDTGQPPKKS